VVVGYRKDPGLGADDRADGEVGFLDGEPGDQEVDVAAAKLTERVVEGALADLQPPVWMGGAEGLKIGPQIVGIACGDAYAEDVGLALSGQAGSLHALAQALIDRPKVVAQLLTDRCQSHYAAGPFEQRRADAAFLLLDRLADASLGHMQPSRRAAEVQLLGQGQEDLDVPQLHRRPFRTISARLWHVA